MAIFDDKYYRLKCEILGVKLIEVDLEILYYPVITRHFCDNSSLAYFGYARAREVKSLIK